VCKNIVYRSGKDLRAVLSLALSSLFLIFVTISTPLLDISILGIHKNLSIYNSYFLLLNNNLFLPSFILIITIFIIPIMMLFSIIVIILFTFFHKSLKKITFIFKFYHFLKEWNMAEVYLVAVLVSMIKLNNISLMKLDTGLYLFFLFLFTFLLTVRFFNPHDVWHR
jgi:paraquat-inducible protein A